MISRRGLLKGMLGAGGAIIGSRIAGPLVREAAAAELPSSFVHVFFNGGLNALFSGNADKYVSGNVFGVTSSNIKTVGNGVVTDASTFGTFSQTALDHWAAVGIKHNQALHTTPQNQKSGGERAILTDGTNCYLNQLAHAMGGDSAFPAVYFGDRAPAYREQPAFEGVSLQRVQNLSDAMKTVGAAPADPSGPNRELAAVSLESAQAISARQTTQSPTRLGALGDAYGAAVAALRKAPAKPVTLDEINTAYQLGGKSEVSSFASMLGGAEIMIRAAGTNVVNVTDFGLTSWDFHQLSGGVSANGTYSRKKMLATSGGGISRIAALKIFLDRMLAIEDRNVVVCISGEMVRLPNGDHGDGSVAAVFSNKTRQGVSFGVDSKSRFASGTPDVKGFWAGIAAACGVQGSPFGANPHSKLLG